MKKRADGLFGELEKDAEKQAEFFAGINGKRAQEDLELQLAQRQKGRSSRLSDHLRKMAEGTQEQVERSLALQQTMLQARTQAIIFDVTAVPAEKPEFEARAKIIESALSKKRDKGLSEEEKSTQMVLEMFEAGKVPFASQAEKQQRVVLARQALSLHRLENSEHRLLNAVSRNEKSRIKLKQTLSARPGMDPEEAFRQVVEEEARQNPDSELAKLWKSYHLAREFRDIQDILPLPDLPGKTVEFPSVVQMSGAKNAIERADSSLHFDMSGGNKGVISFGTNLRRPAEVYSVDGKLQICIVDRNADKGRRGPLDFAEVRENMGQVLVDEYFTEKFHEFGRMDLAHDPSAVPDRQLFDIVYAFLPKDFEKTAVGLAPEHQQLIANIAFYFARPANKSVPMADRVKNIWEKVKGASDSSRALAAQMLKESDFSKNPAAAQAFDSKLA